MQNSSEWRPDNYPQDYVEGFSLPDNEAVQRVLQHLLGLGKQVDAVVVETNEQGTIVHTLSGDAMSEVNWARPQTEPKDLEGYARTVYQFAGPHDQQIRRAELLAQAANAKQGVMTMEQISADSTIVSFMSIGLKVRKPEGWT